jgi:peptidoglycan L-alanyl-D-glutamate endopeptidase CwlK
MTTTSNPGPAPQQPVAPQQPLGAPLAITPELVHKLFPATPLANIQANLPAILAALNAVHLGDTPMVLMALSTIRAETESFEPISEMQSRFNTSPSGDHPFDLYDGRADLGNQGPPDGASFRGRGFVQLTGRANYTKYAQRTGHDLVNHPELACQLDVAAQLLAVFLADKEPAIRQALAKNNLAAARRLVNGGTNGLDRFSACYSSGCTVLA